MPLFTASSPFDSDVERATSELNTKTDWQLTREICARASQSPSTARDCLRSIVKRINHVDPHVALQALFLLEQCATHSGLNFRQEVASRDFVSECRTLITNGKTHTKVIRQLKQLIRVWADGEFKSDPSLSLIPSLFSSLRTEGHTFPVDDMSSTKDNTSQQEADDLARAIALSLEQSGKQQPSSRSLYPSVSQSAGAGPKDPRKVRALYDFEAAEDNELTFKAGEFLSVLDDSDPNWWKGSSWRGEGLFPANFVTADLTAEIEPEISKPRKSVRFHDEVDVQVVESAPVEVFDVDEGKIDEALSLIQNADPTTENDSPELLTLEDQCRSMGPLIDQELETIDRQHNRLVEVNSQLMEAFQMYHSLMQGLPGYGYVPVATGSPVLSQSVTHQMQAGQQYLAQSGCLPQSVYVAPPPQLPYHPAAVVPGYLPTTYTAQNNSAGLQNTVPALPNNYVLHQAQSIVNGNNSSDSNGASSGAAVHFTSPQHTYCTPPGGSTVTADERLFNPLVATAVTAQNIL